MMYHDIQELKQFFRENPLYSCFTEGRFSPEKTYEFFSTLVYHNENFGRCISLIVNMITVTLIQEYCKDQYGYYIDPIMRGELITAICNNEAFNHGSHLNVMKSYIKYNEDNSYDIKIDKKVITNVGAADLLFVNLSILDKNNKFVIALFENHEISQKSISEQLAGLTSCPSGSVFADLKQEKNIKIASESNKSLLLMRHMYNMERFLIGCLAAGILKKIVAYALQESDADSTGKFHNQYLQDKIILIFTQYIKLDSLIKNFIQHWHEDATIEPLLSLIKLSCIDDVHQAIMLLKEICGAKSYFKNHVTAKLLKDHEAIYNLGGTKELMKQTLYSDLKSKKIRSLYA